MIWIYHYHYRNRRKTFLLIVMVFSLVSVSVAYAVNYNQIITETINLSVSTHDWLTQLTYNINPFISFNHPIPSTVERIVACINITTTSFSDCGFSIEFSLISSGSIANIILSGCNISPVSIQGNGNPITFTVSEGCNAITATLPVGYTFSGTGLGVIATSGTVDTLKPYPALVIGDSYSESQITTITKTIIIYQTLTVMPNNGPCTDPTSCGDNQLGAFASLLLPTLVFMATGSYALLQMDVKDERAYIFMLMASITGSAFLSQSGAFGIYIVPWYVAIFVDIIGFLLMLVHRD